MDEEIKTSQQELEQTAAALEQILEVMPDDPFTMRALYETSLKLEQPDRAFQWLTRLDDFARAAQDSEQIDFVLEQYASVVDDMPDVRKRMDRLEELKLVAGLTQESGESVSSASVAGQKPDVEPELALAWELFQDEQLSQEEYSGVLHDLTEMSSHELSVPLSVLHVLHDQNFSRFERLMSHLSQQSGVPIISLSLFDEREELRTVLPFEWISRRGALPFGFVGGDLMVAVLNPRNRILLDEVSAYTGQTCHAYLVSPQEYDQRLAAIKKELAA